MKKLFTVLAVLLVASVAFAGFSGSVKAGYTFDFDEKTIGYATPGFGKVDVTFGWDSPVYTVGEAEGTHIEFALSTNFKGFYKLSEDHAKGYLPFRAADDWTWWISLVDYTHLTETVMGINLSVDTFKIVGSNWEVSFVDTLGLDFAKSAIDSKRFNKNKIEDNTQYYSMSNSVKGKHNLVATVAGYKFGFGLGTLVKGDDDHDYKNNWTDALTFALTGVTPEYDFNGVKAQFGAGYQVYDNDWALAASAKASYATDKLAVSGAYDLKYENEFVKNDLAVKVNVAPVTVDVYFANEGATATDKFYDYFDYDEVNVKEADHEDTKDPNYLSAKVVVDVAKVAENVPVTVTLTGTKLLTEEKQILSAKASTKIVPNFEFGVYFNDWFNNDSEANVKKRTNSNGQKLGGTVKFTGLEKVTLNAEVAYKFAKDVDEAKRLYMNAGAAYAHELFTADATVGMEKPYDKDAVFGATVGAKSTTLVKGAELSAKAYFNLKNMAYIDESYNATNKIDLTCKVSF